jgi:hypothetical protein
MSNVSEVEVTVSVTVNGSTISKTASGSTSDNPYRLADSIISAAHSEASNALSKPRLAWDSQRQTGGRGTPARQPNQAATIPHPAIPVRVPTRQQNTLMGSFVDYTYAHPFTTIGYVLLVVLMVVAALGIADAIAVTVGR